jgi:hypothetical protein
MANRFVNFDTPLCSATHHVRTPPTSQHKEQERSPHAAMQRKNQIAMGAERSQRNALDAAGCRSLIG